MTILPTNWLQMTIDYIFDNTEHPFYYIDTLPLDIIKSIFDEIKPNIRGINFYIKTNSCIAEALAFNRLNRKWICF